MVLDLFGTLVAAPTSGERTEAAERLARVIGCDPEAVDRYLCDTWTVRHDGTLATVADLAAHLVQAMTGSGRALGRVVAELRNLGSRRLAPDASVVLTLQSLRDKGLSIGVLSDASAEVAGCWPSSALAELVDDAVFSCQAGAVKPDARLYDRIGDDLEVSADRILYVGDGGGDELRGALACGMTAVAVRRRGPCNALGFGDTDWFGHVLDRVELVPDFMLADRP